MKCKLQSDHEWERITDPLWPFRCKCKKCGVIGKMYGKRKGKGRDKILPIKTVS